jgi:hypothetical protein
MKFVCFYRIAGLAGRKKVYLGSSGRSEIWFFGSVRFGSVCDGCGWRCWLVVSMYFKPTGLKNLSTCKLFARIRLCVASKWCGAIVRYG